MKKTVKRILTAFVCAAMLISCFGVFVYADTPLKGSYVEFVKDDSANTISAKAYVRNPEGNAETAAWLLLAEYNGDVMEKAATNKLTLAAGKEDFITTAAIKFNSARKYNAFLWYGDESCRPIAPTATYGYNGQLLTGIAIDGVEMEGFDANKKEYKLPPADDFVVPVTKGITADNSVYTTTSYEKSGNDYIAKVSAKSSNGTKTETYTITYSVPVDYDTTKGYNAWHAISDYNEKDMTGWENWTEDARTYNGWYAAGSETNPTSTTPVLCSNLHGNSNLSNADITGSRWVIDYSPAKGIETEQGQQMLRVPDSISGLDYFVFSNNRRVDTTNNNVTTPGIYKNGDNLVSFKINKSAEVVIYSYGDTDKYKDADGAFADSTTISSEAEVPVAAYKQTTFICSTEITNKSWENALKTTGAVQEIKYWYKTSKVYTVDDNSTKTITISMASDLKDRTPIVVIKPIIEVKPMFEYNMPYGGMTLDQFCTATGATKNTEYTGDSSRKIAVNEVRKVTENDFTYGGKTGGTIVEHGSQRYLTKVEKTSGLENAYLTATDRSLVRDARTKEWDYYIFYKAGSSDTKPYPLTEESPKSFVWQTFKVERDCEVFVFGYYSQYPAFLNNDSWTKLDFDTEDKNRSISSPLQATRGNFYNSGNTSLYNMKYRYAFVKEFKKGDIVNLYNNTNEDFGAELPYMTVVRFK